MDGQELISRMRAPNDFEKELWANVLLASILAGKEYGWAQNWADLAAADVRERFGRRTEG